jgi:hypothetical protein
MLTARAAPGCRPGHRLGRGGGTAVTRGADNGAMIDDRSLSRLLILTGILVAVVAVLAILLNLIAQP